jgi:hypothetical protein
MIRKRTELECTTSLNVTHTQFCRRKMLHLRFRQTESMIAIVFWQDSILCASSFQGHDIIFLSMLKSAMLFSIIIEV